MSTANIVLVLSYYVYYLFDIWLPYCYDNSMNFLIVNLNTWQNQRDGFDTLRGAKICFTRMKYDSKNFAVMSYEDWRAGDVQVEVTNKMSGLPCMIARSRVGSCCDPSTERYWSM
jgi:uncharacterized protein YydD (DUF2326 family)